MISDQLAQLLGTTGVKYNPIGAAKYSAPNNYCFAGFIPISETATVASCEKNVNGTVSADATCSAIGIAVPQGIFHPFVNNIVSVTLTNATDQNQYVLKRLSL